MALDPSTRYPGQVDVSDPAGYPYGKAQNIIVTGDGIGTPREKDGTNDIYGFQQELLDKAGITPSGTADKVGASQYVEAIRKIAGFPGTWQPYSLNDDPAVLGVRLLLLDGSGVLAANYPDLVANVAVPSFQNGTVFSAGGKFYRASDAAGTLPAVGGAYLILPDMRGKFLRGLDPTAIHDPDGATRLFGGTQAWAIFWHNHFVEDAATSGTQMFIDVFSTTAGGSKLGQADVSTALGAMTAGTITNTSGAPTGATNLDASESRPVNDVCNWGIWY